MATIPIGTTIPQGATSFYDFSQGDGGQVPPGTDTTPDDKKPGSGGSSTSSTTTTTVASSPYAQFRGNNYEELEEFLRNQMKEVKTETPQEKEKREKREKRLGFLARLADGLGTFHTAFSYARGVKPMDMPKMSAKAQEKFEKAKAQRDKDNDRLVNYAITLGNIKDKDRDFNFRVTQAEQQQNNWQQQFDAGREDRANDVAYRDKAYADSRQDRKDDVAFRDKQFDEGKRQFDEGQKTQRMGIAEQGRHNRAMEGLEGQRIAASQDGKYTEFMTNDGEIIRVPNSRINLQTIGAVYKATGLPATRTEYKNYQPVQVPLSSDEMLSGIGQNIDNADVQNALRQLGGVK